MRIQQGGSGGVVICLGVGGLVDLSAILGLESTEDGEDPTGAVEVWLFDARRPWNLGNVFGGNPADMVSEEISGNARVRDPGVEDGKIRQNYKPGKGGIIVYDDGDIDQDLKAEKQAYRELAQMPDVEDDGESDVSEAESKDADSMDEGRPSKKRKSWSDRDEEPDGNDEENDRPRRRRKDNTV